MPEGDTIWRAARTLEKVLVDKTITGCRSPLPEISGEELVGHQIKHIESRGKNLLMHFDHDRILYTHMRMHGSWHIYRRGAAWQKPERLARVVMETDQMVAVCFNAPIVQLLTERQAARHRTLQALGPDLLAEGFDGAKALENLRLRNDLPIADPIMDQRALAGTGNVYKSEVLFLCGIDPRRKV